MRRVKGGLTFWGARQQKRPPSDEMAAFLRKTWAYLPVVRWLPIDVNLPVIALVRKGMAVISARAMAAAIRPYSMAVAPEVSDKNLRSTANPSRVNGYALRLTAKR